MHTADDLLDGFTGTIITPESPGYAQAARTALGTAEPAIVLRPTDVADVQRAVRFAAASDRPLVVRGGGHSAAGLSTADDAMRYFHGWRATWLPQRCQAPLLSTPAARSRASRASRFLDQGRLEVASFRPAKPRSAGSKVVDASTITATTMAAA